MAATKFSGLPTQSRALWAKSGKPLGHGLLAHMLDVAAVTEVLLEHEPPSTLEYFAARLSLPESSFRRYAAALVGLHDFGKAIPGFQAKWPQGREQRGEDVRLILFHARFPADQRDEREQEVLKVFGNSGTDHLRPDRVLLIATQVAEQSLDIDFDFLITDLAPVDLILQRAGRLHRHQRIRPQTHAKARLIVAGLKG